MEWELLDRAHVWHPYTHHGTSPPPVPIVRGSGAYLYDAHGQRLFDAISSWWVTLHGHSNSVIGDAIAAQARMLEQVVFAGFTHEPASRLAAALTEVLPSGLDRTFFSDDGSTAVEVAIKIAIQYWANLGEARPVIAALDNAYHGDTFGAMSVSGRGLFNDAFGSYLFEVARLPDPTQGDLVEALETMIDERGHELAAVIVEPLLQGAGGMRVWSAETLRAVRRLTSEHGILLIADEVLTGFGRVGPLFACSRASVEPDIMCLSKGLTGGFLPMGATATTNEIFDAFCAPGSRFTLFHGHSYTANPLACAAALASLSLLDEGSRQRRLAIENAHELFLPRLTQHPRVKNPRILGTVAAFDIDVKDGSGGYMDPVGQAIKAHAIANGVLLRPLGNVVYFIPPFCSDQDDIANAYDVVHRFLETYD